jgi:hypothetical protein
MKLRHWMIGVSSCLFIAGAAGAGCSSTETSNPPAVDAGKDVSVADGNTPDVVKDAPVETGPSCQKDADFTQLPVPDASLNDGGTNTGVCVSCVRQNCNTQAQACANDCECNNFVLGFFTCVGGGGSLINCGSGLLSLPQSSRKAGQDLVTCVFGSCQSECGVPNLDGGTDAPSDAGSGG